MISNFANAIGLLTLAAFSIVCLGLLGVAAYVWARAMAEVARALSHMISAVEQKKTTDEANKALDDLQEASISREYTPPPEDSELLDAVMAARAVRTSGNGRPEAAQTPFDPEEREYSTRDNEMRNPPRDEEPIIAADRMYAE